MKIKNDYSDAKKGTFGYSYNTLIEVGMLNSMECEECGREVLVGGNVTMDKETYYPVKIKDLESRINNLNNDHFYCTHCGALNE